MHAGVFLSESDCNVRLQLWKDRLTQAGMEGGAFFSLMLLFRNKYFLRRVLNKVLYGD